MWGGKRSEVEGRRMVCGVEDMVGGIERGLVDGEEVRVMLMMSGI